MENEQPQEAKKKVTDAQDEIKDLILGLREMRSTKAMLASEKSKLESLRKKLPEAIPDTRYSQSETDEPEAPAATPEEKLPEAIPDTHYSQSETEEPGAPAAPPEYKLSEAFPDKSADQFARKIEQSTEFIDEKDTSISRVSDSTLQKTEELLKTMSERLRSYIDESVAPRLDKGVPNGGNMGTNSLALEFSELKEAILGLKSGLETLKENQTVELDEKLRGQTGNIANRFDKIETFISDTNAGMLQQTEERLTAASERLRSYVEESLAPRLDTGTRETLNAGLKILDSRFSGLSPELAALNAGLSGLSTGLAGLKSDIGVLKERPVDMSVEKLQGFFDKLELRLGKIETLMDKSNESIKRQSDERLKGFEERIEGHIVRNYDRILSRVESALSERMEIGLKSVAEEISSMKDVLINTGNKFTSPVNESTVKELRGLSVKLDSLDDSLSALSGETTEAIKSLVNDIGKVEQTTESISSRLDEEVKHTIMADMVSLKEGIIEIIRFLMATK
ncbi:MAG: hypothetical protein HQK89_01110 [Nitrospirae bacterium]|nr:hypothetical protein [Nitrospirota bacterium]